MHDTDPEKVRMMKSHFVRNPEFFSEDSKREKGGVRFVWNWHLSSFFMFLRIFFFFSPGRRQLCKWHRCCCSTAAAKNCLVFFWKVLTWCLSWTEAKLQPVKALTAKNKIFRLLSIISQKKDPCVDYFRFLKGDIPLSKISLACVSCETRFCIFYSTRKKRETILSNGRKAFFHRGIGCHASTETKMEKTERVVKRNFNTPSIFLKTFCSLKKILWPGVGTEKWKASLNSETKC